MFNNKGYIVKLRASRTLKGIATLLLLSLVFEIVQPSVSLALTEGPSQPEVQSFEPIGTTQMVDLFTGDFNYNIPLFNLPGPNGGYPVNLSYHAGVSADDEASWVGLGWNINAGSLVRNMRGLPDEFMSEPMPDAIGDEQLNADINAKADHDYLEVKQDMKQNMTLGIRGSKKWELGGADLAPDQFSLGASIYYNNYRGLGASLSPSIGWEGESVSGGLGLSMDSENGLGVSANLGLKDVHRGAERTRSLSVTFDGNLSVDYSLRMDKVRYVEKENPVIGEARFDTKLLSGNYGSSFTFARASFSPSLGFRMINWNFSGSLSAGPSISGFYSGTSVGVFFNTQDYDNREKNGRKHLVQGYDRSGYGGNEYYARDFSREKDGAITVGSQFLPHANYTYDTYSSTGQGLSGYFRPRRNDVGRVYDPKMKNETFGGSISFEAGSGKAGIDGGLNVGWNSQGPWNGGSEKNDLDYDFSNPRPISSSTYADENLYYAAHGEQTILESSDIDYMMGLDLADLKFANKGVDGAYLGKRKLRPQENDSRYNSKKATPGSGNEQTHRNKRNTMIHNLRNKEVDNLGEFNIKYYEWSGSLDLSEAPAQSLNRDTRNGVIIDEHYAGFKVLNEEGAYYVYGLPAYNNKEVDNLFSTHEADVETSGNKQFEDIGIDNSEVDYKNYAKGHQFINKTTKSPYAHSYLLTSVQGADYVDLLNDGPTNDDLGYWVKFDYVRANDSYKWRAPYDNSKAFFSRGAAYTNEDDKASYQYGEKEIWYMGRMETKTHIAIFKLLPRQDMIEASAEMAESPDTDLSNQDKGLYVDKIVVYEKKAFLQNGESARPLQEVHFDYDYQLCKETPNSTASTKGKLTLKNVWFTSNGSTRGALNKYTFDYTTPDFPSEYVNPNFVQGAYDSWGNYRPRIANKHEHATHFPYVNQFNQDWDTDDTWEPGYGNNLQNQAAKDLTKTTQDAMASAWCLRKITLPSGGQININYESDDYGYVQHKTANQMFKIASMGEVGNQLYNGEDDENFVSFPEKRRVYFKLEKPIPLTGLTDLEKATAIYKQYVEPIHAENGDRNLYFKSKMKLTDFSWDYVSGYLPLERELKQVDGSTYFYGVATTNDQLSGVSHSATIDGVDCYTHGFVTLKATPKIRKPNESYNYHPMSLAAWTYLQTDAQELLMNANSFETDGGNDAGVLSKIGDFLNIAPAVAQSFGGIRSYCQRKDFARYINLDYSCIRLASPDKIKYGGGHRVKQITITDNWSASTNDNDRTYGQSYDYTIMEDGQRISSGVAQYEPQAGGDENALKYPYYFHERQTYFTRNNLFAEAPFNESLFPGASVGYRKVTVKSTNTDTQITRNANQQVATGRTGGVTEHEFYTAKDFPTRVEWSLLAEENSTKDAYNLGFPIPLIGSLKFNYYHGTQAYKIELNDMHGKPKSVKSFELNNYVVNANPITESEYEYQCHTETYMGEKVYVLDNEVPIIKNDHTHDLYKEGGIVSKKLMGVEVDLYTDQRESKAFHVSAGIDFNVDVLPFPIPWLSVWPSYSSQKSIFRTYVTNKVVHKTGILKRTKTRDLQTVNESEIIAYDEQSGLPLLTKIKNEFGDNFYNYNIPAYYAYDRMGHAYRNIDYTFHAELTHDDCYYTFDEDDKHLNNLVRGDELLITNEPNTAPVKGYFLGWKYDADEVVQGMVHVPNGTISSGLEIELRVIRSGRRNHYATMAANYLTKYTLTENGVLSLANVTQPDGQPYPYAQKIDKNVLSATASLFKDDWMDEKQGTFTSGYDEAERPYEAFSGDDVVNPFLTGNSGIWRPYKAYTYVGKRKSSANYDTQSTEQNPELFNDGVFVDQVPMFTWDLGPMEDYVGASNSTPYKNWEWVNEVTRYSKDAYELENVNRLGIFSSALYGYGNSLSIAVGGNASYYEIGVLDFETAKTTSTLPFGTTLAENNLNVYNDATGRPEMMLISEHKNFSDAVYTSDGYLTVTLKFKDQTERDQIYLQLPDLLSGGQQQPVSSGAGSIENTFGLSLVSKQSNVKGNESVFLNARMVYGQTATIPNSTTIVLKLIPYVCGTDDTPHYLKPGSYHSGKLTMLLKRKVSTLPDITKVGFVPHQTDYKKAHTGKLAMKLTGSVLFDQPKIKVLPNKSYVLSMWVSRANTDVSTFQQNILVQACMMDVSGSPFLEIPNRKITFGKVIEGWQKVDIEFKITGGGDYDGKIFAINFNPGESALYVDDIRFSPKTGGMMTYVYDPFNFWLRASLNVDNYATLFFYDEEGNMTLKKQETEEGIFTLQESRGRLKK
ncbi:MAG: hypothetical protein A3D31_01165 [Candidatus Fluviicola riflensis]|nr:MAG: hypothetical protein CHH17_04375 [Candidatus Fluviicola riflensis]OGS76216.1 MAG: hypothetical protein A3D31_01165 [Candidatus Fluviicola riflensis]OGS83240.1 MAG: hypothetical protein A2724_00675 [Fluviicola sp. RIFCSPHIGHO2_01_FULL_43_53]OGS83748.1 MAG: hypothetical protein A3E30_17770 [Fluviicola sp. RIFCSPHIGHO2_12_FULL_43_24]